MGSVILTFIAAVFIIYLSYVVSKYVGRGMNKNGNSHYMRVVDQLMVGQDRYVAVVQAGERIGAGTKRTCIRRKSAF